MIEKCLKSVDLVFESVYIKDVMIRRAYQYVEKMRKVENDKRRNHNDRL